MKTRTFSIRMSEELIGRLEAATDNKTAFIIEAVEEKLAPALTVTEKREALKGAKNLSDLMQDLILQEASSRKNFLANMDNETFAKLVAARLPKELQEDGALDADVLSLESSLASMPQVSDLTGELNTVKGKLAKAELERDINLKLLKHSQNKADLAELMDLIYRKVVEYVVELIARRNLPGFGDGGGLTDAGYAEVSNQVKKELETLQVLK